MNDNLCRRRHWASGSHYSRDLLFRMGLCTIPEALSQSLLVSGLVSVLYAHAVGTIVCLLLHAGKL
jgi:hypothetical protein